jgi:hypothetical protein
LPRITVNKNRQHPSPVQIGGGKSVEHFGPAGSEDDRKDGASKYF